MLANKGTDKLNGLNKKDTTSIGTSKKAWLKDVCGGKKSKKAFFPFFGFKKYKMKNALVGSLPTFNQGLEVRFGHIPRRQHSL
jgi:hypothetical protein